MESKVRFPIRRKLLALMIALLIGAIAAYLFLAIRLFQEDKTTLVYELNSSLVRTLSAELKADFARVTDKVRLLSQGYKDSNWTRVILEHDSQIVAFSLFSAGSEPGKWERVAFVPQKTFIDLYHLESAQVSELRKHLPLEGAKILAQKVVILPGKLSSEAYVVTLMLSLNLEGSTVPSIAVVDLKLDRFVEFFQNKGIATVFAVNPDGTVLFPRDAESLGKTPLVEEALKSPVALQMKQIEVQGERWLGAFGDVGFGGLKVIAQVPENTVFHAAGRLINKSLIFGIIVLTVALFLSGLVARGLTEPLHQLVSFTERVAKWEFGEKVNVRTNDEIGQLAKAFNDMSTNLHHQRIQIDKHQAELEQKVKERTADLESQKRKAAEANEALVRSTRLASLGELAGVAAHEVLNPINNISIRIERMRDKTVKAEAQDGKILTEILKGWNAAYASGGWPALQKELSRQAGEKSVLEEDLQNLQSIAGDTQARVGERAQDLTFLEKELFRISRIVDNMRRLARVKGGHETLNIYEPIDNTLAAMSDLLEKQRVSLKTEFDPSGEKKFSILADQDELVQVFSNLIRNAMQAIHATQKGGGEIRLATRHLPDRIEIRISDSGAGISQENIGRVFEPNFSTKSVEEGTGLGLSICRRLVRAVGGDITVETTNPGKGTTFLVWIPHARTRSTSQTEDASWKKTAGS